VWGRSSPRGSERDLSGQYLKFDFKNSNNQAEFEVILARLTLAHDMAARQVHYKSDSQLVVSQVKGVFKVKESLLSKYYHLVQTFISNFESIQIKHIR